MRFRGRTVEPGAGPFLMGILNVTPDSFSDGGQYATVNAAVEAGCRMADEGADAIDVGGESTRPGSKPVSAQEQIRRVLPVVAELSRRFGATGPAISIDCRLASVAEATLSAGASVINDISALRDDSTLAKVVARHHAGLVLMHMQNSPADMQAEPTYRDVVAEVHAFLAERVESALAAGIARNRLMIDPGIGFGKTATHNLELLNRLDSFRDLGLPMLVGPSRKRFIAEVTGATAIADRLPGTIAAVSACVLAGVEIIRVHDVLACRRAADLCAAIRSSQ
ncbi:MAG: dihydropteroate synthase [Phycisphaerae bacterium]|nr:dihydropteroate synthase [Phycisphaerae bacterium]